MTFPEMLRKLLKDADYTQTEFADRIGVSQQTVSRWVRGQFQPDIDQLIACAHVFNVSVDYLLGKDCITSNEIAKPIVNDDGLRAKAIERVQDLPDPVLARVLDFLDGIQVGRGIAAGEEADSDPAG